MSQETEIRDRERPIPPPHLTKATYAVWGQWCNGWYPQGEFEDPEMAEAAALNMRSDCIASAVVRVQRFMVEVYSLPDKEKADAAWRKAGPKFFGGGQ